MSRSTGPARCRSCDAEIYFLRTRGGRRIPVEIHTQTGQQVDPRDTFAQSRHVPHFAACPGAEQHRGPRGAAAPPAGPPRILGVTLWQPWPWAICWAGCPVANLTWEPRALPAPGTFLAIHAGPMYDEQTARWIAMEHGAVVPPRDHLHRMAVLAVAEFAGMAPVERAPWQREEHALLLARATPIQPVHCDGERGLWALPARVYQRVRAAYAEARQRPVTPQTLTAAGLPADDR